MKCSHTDNFFDMVSITSELTSSEHSVNINKLDFAISIRLSELSESYENRCFQNTAAAFMGST